MTIEVKAKKSNILEYQKFVNFTIEVLDKEYCNLIVDDKDCDNLTDILDRYQINWRLV